MKKKLIDAAPIFNDVCTLKVSDISRKPVVITAGFPCQDVSIANPHALGVHGPRTGLVKQVYRLVDELRTVKLIILENSPIIMTRGGQSVVKALKQRGFSVSWTIISCSDVGAPLLRKRWFCIAQKDHFDIPLLSIPADRWSRETSPRLIHRNSTLARTAIVRCRLLGNAIVPQQLAFAINALLHGSKTAVHKRSVQLDMMQGTTRFKKNTWGSPGSRWYQYDILTDRSARMLSNQVFYDAKTVEAFNDSTGKLYDLYLVSPRWVEWLCGFPRDWTQFPVEKNSKYPDMG